MSQTLSQEPLWDAILAEVEGRLRRQQFETWFRCILPVEVTDQKLSLSVPNRFYKEWLEMYYVPVLKESATSVTGVSPVVVFEISSQPVRRPPEDTPAASPRENPPAPVAPSGEEGLGQVEGAAAHRFSPYNTFDNFVVGPANRLCHAAALAVVEAPGRAYNPLFIHGGSGLGKTHLLHAIGHTAVAHGMQVLFVSAEQFTNELISAIREKSTAEFRKKYRNVDMLLVDDVQFIGGKEQTKENFFHTFNELHDTNRQIAITSDCPPRSIPSLQDRLSSRFEWGLVTDIKPPDFDTRLEILKAKADHDGIEITPDVLEVIALQVKQNIRALEGSLNRVVAYARLLRSEITPEVTTQALEDIASKVPRLAPVTPGLIIETVADIFQVPVSDIKGRRRDESTGLARQASMYLMRQESDSSLAQIGRELDGRSSATISYAYEKIANSINNDPHLRRQVFNTQQKIHAASSR